MAKGKRDDIEAKRLAAAKRLKGILQKFSTFVSIDAVDSTGMKMGETEEDIIFSFLAYQKLVEDAIARHTGQVVSISGDGIMSRFALSQEAVDFALDLFRELSTFNTTGHLLKSPFRIRMGINTGQIYVDSTGQTAMLQLLPSSTIDIAGYLQKHAPPNTAWLSQFTIEQLEHPAADIRKDHMDKRFGFAVYSYSSGPVKTKKVPKSTLKRKILIVEDEPDQAYLLAQGFQTAGYETDIAFDGEEGLIHIKTFQPDLVMLDIGLPRMDGWQVLHEMKSNRMAPKMPVLMLARRYHVEDVERSFALGASGCIRKPCDLGHLMKKVETVLAD